MSAISTNSIKQNQHNKELDQVLYNEMWIERNKFRAFVYRGQEKKLANSYDDFLGLLMQGWNEYPDGKKTKTPKIIDHDELNELPEYQEMIAAPLAEPVKRGRRKKQIDILS